MLMAARGGGRVLITYLQWRSLDGLARPSKNSCEIRRNNRRVAAVAVAEGGTRGGFAAAEALHSNGMGCLEWRDTLPTPFPTSSPLSSSATNLTTLRRERERGGVIVPLQPEPRLVLEYQMWQRTRKVSCLCFVKCAITKWWAPPVSDPFCHPRIQTHQTYAGVSFLAGAPASLTYWRLVQRCRNVHTHTHTDDWQGGWGGMYTHR